MGTSAAMGARGASNPFTCCYAAGGDPGGGPDGGAGPPVFVGGDAFTGAAERRSLSVAWPTPVGRAAAGGTGSCAALGGEGMAGR